MMLMKNVDERRNDEKKWTRFVDFKQANECYVL